jgi:uncharacterized surface protein with fasciclin (FAS1) repeats
MKFAMKVGIFLVLVITLAGEGMAAQKDIVDTAAANANLSQLVDLVKEAGLVDTLKGPGPFTVFAPNNDAFFNIPKEDLKALMENTTDLKKVLTYHVVAGKLMAKDLKNGMQLKTLQGENLTVKVGPEGVMIAGAKVIEPDINASNGVIHIINAVLMPT